MGKGKPTDPKHLVHAAEEAAASPMVRPGDMFEPFDYGGYRWTSGYAFAAHMGIEALKLSLGQPTEIAPSEILRWLEMAVQLQEQR